MTTVINPSPRESLGLGSASTAPRNMPLRPAAEARRRAASILLERSVPKLGVVAGRGVFTAFLVLAALLFLFLAVGPRVLNYQTSTMLTGSMSPESTRVTS